MRRLLLLLSVALLPVLSCMAQSQSAADWGTEPRDASGVVKNTRAEWMEGKWGFRFNMPSMRDPQALADFDVEEMIEQIKTLDSASWVQINITQGANGSFYTSPHAELAEHVSPDMVPKRDLFGEMLNALNKQGLKVIVYFATEGPTMSKHAEKGLPGVADRWKSYVASKGMTPEQGVADIIVKEFSLRYGAKIAGWWFDHAKYGNIPLLAAAARAGNPNAVLAFNLTASPALVASTEGDFTAGHPTPLEKQPASWKGNEVAFKLMEENNYADRCLRHFFPPMQTRWNNGDPVFPTEMAIDWTMRAVKAHAAITWAVALEDSRNHRGPLAEVQFAQLKAINEAVRTWRSAP